MRSLSQPPSETASEEIELPLSAEFDCEETKMVDLNLKKKKKKSSLLADPSAPCSSSGHMWEVSLIGDKGEEIALPVLVGMEETINLCTTRHLAGMWMFSIGRKPRFQT